MMSKSFNSSELTRWAMNCGTQANDPNLATWERERLLKMKAALLDLAATQEWLEGKSERVTIEFVVPENDASAQGA